MILLTLEELVLFLQFTSLRLFEINPSSLLKGRFSASIIILSLFWCRLYRKIPSFFNENFVQPHSIEIFSYQFRTFFLEVLSDLIKVVFAVGIGNVERLYH